MSISTFKSLFSHLRSIIYEYARCREAWYELDSKMPQVNRAFNQVRNELAQVGLLAENIYLDQIDLVISPIPNHGEAGYVFEEMSFLPRLVGYKEGVIYLPADIPHESYVPGGTMTDTIRHEFAHSWHWIEPSFFRRPWFKKAFDTDYDNTDPDPYENWCSKIKNSRRFKKEYFAKRSNRTRAQVLNRYLLNDFPTGYAATCSSEDFAETFMFFLKYRNSLERFRHRKGFYRKLLAVKKAVNIARKELGL